MKQLVRTGALLAVVLFIPLSSRADLVLKDSSYGPGTIIEDTVTHLDWLKLTVTQNRSFDDVSSKFGPGEEFAGFQYGDVVQVGQLFKDGGLPSIVPSDMPDFGNINSSQNPSDVAAVTNLITLFGSTFSDADHPIESMGIIGSHDLIGLGPTVDIARLSVQTTFICTAMHCATANTFGVEISGPGILDTPFPDSGSFLFESAPAAVPEPSFTILIGIGLMSIALDRKST